MNGSHLDLAEYDALEPARFGYLEGLELSQVVDPENWSGLTLKLRLRPSGATESPRLWLEFHEVQELRIGPLQGLSFYCVEVRSAAAMQLEGRNYHVVENDHNAFSFFCRNFLATVENP
jgi:hypothetical protein